MTTTWVLSLPETVKTVFTERLLARTVFGRSIKVLDWQTGAAKCGSTIFRKRSPGFFEFHRSSDTQMGTLALSNRLYGLYKTFPTRAWFKRSIRVLGWQLGTANFLDHVFPKKKTSRLFGIHRTSANHMGTVAT